MNTLRNRFDVFFGRHRTRAETSRAGSCRAPDGFSLIEVVVAMVLLAVVLVTLAGMTFATARQSMNVQEIGVRQGILLHAANRLNALPFDSVKTACDNTYEGADGRVYQLCVTVTGTGSTRDVQVTVEAGNKADTLTFTRARPLRVN